MFRRSPSHEPEPGVVSDVFTDGAIEVVDLDAKRLRLVGDSYEVRQ